MSMNLTSEMVRAARALLRWDQTDLANAAGVSLPTVNAWKKSPARFRDCAPRRAPLKPHSRRRESSLCMTAARES